MLITADRVWTGPGCIHAKWGARIENGVFTAVGPISKLSGKNDPKHAIGELTIPAKADCLLMPGLINAHCHLELGHLRNRVPEPPDGSFVTWLHSMNSICSRRRQERGSEAYEGLIRQSIRLGANELLSRGTTTLYDHSNSGLPADLLADSPLRLFCAYECIGLDPDRGPEILNRAREYLHGPETPEHHRLAVPHSLYSCSSWLLSELSAEAFHRGTPSIHLAESKDERNLLDSGMGAMRTYVDGIYPDHDINPIEGLNGRLENFYPPRPGMLAVHGYELNEREVQKLAKAGAALVLCPQSREFFDNNLPPFQAIIQSRIPVALGTDSLASCKALSIWREMSALKAAVNLAGSPISSGQILSWATLGGARALGIPAGRIAAGCLADWVTVDVGEIPDDELEDFLVEQEPDITSVGIGGVQIL